MAPTRYRAGLRRAARGAIGAALLALAALPAAAQERVIIATFAGESAKFWHGAVAEPFQAETGIRTEIFPTPLPSANVAAAGGRPAFNVAIIGAYQAPNLAERGMVETLAPEEVPNIRAVPEKYWVRGPDGRLVGVPIYFSYLGIAYNTELAKASDFASWKDLTDPKWRGQVSMSRPVFVGAYDLTLFARLNGGDERNYMAGAPMVEALARNVQSLYTSMASLQAQLGRGEVVAAPFYSTQVTLLRRAGVTNVDMTIPKEGGLMLTYLLVIPKGAASPEAARKLLNAAIAPAYQKRLASGGTWPVNTETKLDPAQEQDLGGTLAEAMARNYAPDWYAVGKSVNERMRLVEGIIDKAR